MGSWFSNIHIRKNGTVTKESIVNYINNLMTARQFMPTASEADADGTVAIVAGEDCQWISVYSDLFSHDDSDSCKAVAMPMSAELHTDVMGISCFDSDYLYINLINADENVDAWVGIGAGKELGIIRRNNLTAWKKKVANYPDFSAATKSEYICADEFLAKTECSLGLPAEQGGASLEYLRETSLQQNATLLYFRQEQAVRCAGPQLQVCYMRYAVPCFDGRENSVSFLNIGDEGCGLSVYFLGPYVQHEEITFSDVKIERFCQPSIDMDLKRIQLLDGQWVYHYHDPEIVIPPGVPQRMKKEKRYRLEMERMCKISFVPHGNPRRMLDVTVVIVPDGNPGNQAKWNVWQQYGSKEEFIKHHNKSWKRVRAFEEDPNQCLPLLKLEDFEE